MYVHNGQNPARPSLERCTRRAGRPGKFKAADILDVLDLTEGQRQTVRRTLHALEEEGWLERDSPQSGIWRLGEKGRLLLNVSSDTIDDSRR